MFSTSRGLRSTALRSPALLALAMVLSACVPDAATGSIRGRVVDASGRPVRGARVMLEGPAGRSTVTNLQGEFRLGGARDGRHAVYALDPSASSGAGGVAHVQEGRVADVGDLALFACDSLPAGEDPDAASEGSPLVPCTSEPPAPPPTVVAFGDLAASFSDAWVTPEGIHGFGAASGGMAFDFFVPGNFLAAGSIVLEPQNDNGYGGDALVVLYAPGGWVWLLRTGAISLETFENGDGDPATSGWRFRGEDLVFEYLTWDAGLDGSRVATVASAAAEGHAWRDAGAPAPEGEVTVATFTAAPSELYRCAGCRDDGADALFVYAWDASNAIELDLVLAVDALPLPGERAVTAGGPVTGRATVHRPDGAWYFELVSVTLVSDSGAVAAGEPLSLTLRDAVFRWSDPAGGPGLRIGMADLSAVVADLGLYRPHSPADPFGSTMERQP